MTRRAADLQHTLWELEQRFGRGTLTPASALAAGLHLPTGFATLDALLAGGGIAAGQVSALCGVPSSGATTLAYRLIASAGARGGIAAYVDLAAAFDAESALACGAALDHLLIVRPANPERGMAIALDLVRAGSAALVVLDAPDGIAPDDLARLRANVARTRCALVVLCINAPDVASLHTLIRLERRDWLTSASGGVTGYRVRAALLRDAGTERHTSAEIEIRLKERLS